MHHAHIDKFAYQDSPIHRLDSRIKFLAVILYTVLVISLPKTSLAVVICYAVGPFVILVLGGIPLGFVLKNILLLQKSQIRQFNSFMCQLSYNKTFKEIEEGLKSPNNLM